ncbi:hypothetical protein OH77DRAFT_1167883 [Trametes cingulata]|nr:hypothetical protein OH77DRAFT_1167883 [Trametes cingulata]
MLAHCSGRRVASPSIRHVLRLSPSHRSAARRRPVSSGLSSQRHSFANAGCTPVLEDGSPHARPQVCGRFNEAHHQGHDEHPSSARRKPSALSRPPSAQTTGRCSTPSRSPE